MHFIAYLLYVFDTVMFYLALSYSAGYSVTYSLWKMQAIQHLLLTCSFFSFFIRLSFGLF